MRISRFSASLLVAAVGLPAFCAGAPAGPKKKAPDPKGTLFDSAPEPAAGSSARLEELMAQLKAMRREIEPILKDLDAVKRGYEGGGEFHELSRRREQIYGVLNDKVSRLSDLEGRFARLVQEEQLARGILLARQFLERRLDDDAGRQVDAIFEVNNFSREVKAFRENIFLSVNSEEAAFKVAREADSAKQRERLLIGAGAMLAGAIVLALGVMWLRRQAALAAESRVSLSLPAPDDAEPPHEAGVLLGGNYRVERELGRGGMGVVYEAMDLSLQRKVAIKRMRDELLQNPADVEGFVKEARMVASLKHPNIVEIYSIFKEGGRVYLVFEYVPGRPLNALLERDGRMPLHAAKAVLRQVSPALDYAHAQKVIHRDLKPSNVMLVEDGTAKVMDFGIAHQAKMTIARLTKTPAGGTPAYMAPEQELGIASRESDLYCLAVCFYEMTTGRLPFTGPNFIAQKLEMRYAPPSEAAPLPAGLDEVMRKALAPKPEDRFHSAAEFLATVEAVAGSITA